MEDFDYGKAVGFQRKGVYVGVDKWRRSSNGGRIKFAVLIQA